MSGYNATMTHYIWEHRFHKPREEVTQADAAWLLFRYFAGEGFWDTDCNEELRSRLVELFGEEPA